MEHNKETGYLIAKDKKHDREDIHDMQDEEIEKQLGNQSHFEAPIFLS
jgi:hypothetical protein